MRSKIRFTSLFMAATLFLAVAVVFFSLSKHKIVEERTKHLGYVEQRVIDNVTAMFEQTEKIALLISENQSFLRELAAPFTTVEEHVEKNKSIETTLSGMILAYPYIETVNVSLSDGETFIITFNGSLAALSTSQIQTLNAFKLPIFTAAQQSGEGAWMVPEMKAPGEHGIENSIYNMILANQFVYSKSAKDGIMIVLSIDPTRVKDQLAKNNAVFSYELLKHGTAADEDKPAYSRRQIPRFGLDLITYMDDPAYNRQMERHVIVLAAAVVLLIVVSSIVSNRFANKVVMPIEWMKRQVSDIRESNSSKDVIQYTLKRKVPASFRSKLFAYLLMLSVSGIAVIFAINYYYTSSIVKTHMEQYYYEYLFQAENSIEFSLKNTEKISSSILRDNKLQQLMYEKNNERVASELKTLFSYHHIISKNINYLNFYNSNGEMVFSTIQSLLNEQNIDSRNIYPLLAKSQGETVYYNEPQDPFGDHVITIAKKFNSTTYPGTLLGYYLLAVNERELNFLNENFGISSLSFSITDSKGEIIFANKDEKLAQQTAALADLDSRDNGMQFVRFAGQDKFVLVGELGETGWKVVSTIDTSEILQGQREIFLLYGYMILVTLAIILGAIYWISRSISQPVQKLASSIRQVVKGEFISRKFQTITGSDEIVELSEHIYTMIEKIQRLMSDVVEFEVKNKEIQLEFQKAELSNLIRQINPHFLYNTLETIKWMTMNLTGGNNYASGMINELAIFLRSSVHSGVGIIPIKEELAHVKSYLNIQQMRYGDRLLVKWKVDEAAAELPITKFVLQPLVENSLLHGIDKRKKRGIILIRVRIAANKLLMSVTDNGMGIERSELLKVNRSIMSKGAKEHIGLQNIRQRLHLIYGERMAMELRSAYTYWTQVYIEILFDQQPHSNLPSNY